MASSSAHGSLSRYVRSRCRCDECTNGMKTYRRDLQVRKATGEAVPRGGRPSHSCGPRAQELVRTNAKNDGECWIWAGRIDGSGYGRRGRYGAHRLSYVAFKGDIDPGMEIDHLCFVTACVNPDHLEQVTPAENQRRRAARQTACKTGHSFSPENTRVRGNRRICRACERESQQRMRARRAAA